VSVCVTVSRFFKYIVSVMSAVQLQHCTVSLRRHCFEHTNSNSEQTLLCSSSRTDSHTVRLQSGHEQADSHTARAKLQHTACDDDLELHDSDFKGRDFVAKRNCQTNKVQRLSSGAKSSKLTHSVHEQQVDTQTSRAKLQRTGHDLDLQLHDTDFKGHDFVAEKTLRACKVRLERLSSGAELYDEEKPKDVRDARRRHCLTETVVPAKKACVTAQHAVHPQSGAETNLITDTSTATANGEPMTSKRVGARTRLPGRVGKISSSKKARVSSQHAVHHQSGVETSLVTGICTSTTNSEPMTLKYAETRTRLPVRFGNCGSSKKARVSREHPAHHQRGAETMLSTSPCTATTNDELISLKPAGTCTRLPGRSGKYRSATRQSVGHFFL